MIEDCQLEFFLFINIILVYNYISYFGQNFQDNVENEKGAFLFVLFLFQCSSDTDLNSSFFHPFGLGAVIFLNTYFSLLVI